MKLLYLSRRNCLALAAFLFSSLSFAQSPGIIVRPAGGNGVTILNPDGNGYASASMSGFASNDISESEIVYKVVPPMITEPTGDIATGPSGGFTDIVRATDNSGFYAFYDGTNILFRLRIGNVINGSKGYSVLIDTDGKIGSAGLYADPNYVSSSSLSKGNPGFEYEVVLRTNFNVSVYNIDGTTTPVLVTSYPLNTHSQISTAITTDSNNPDYFYDFAVPTSAIGNPASFRMVATTVTAPLSAMQGSRSDIYGIDDNLFNNQASAWQAVASAQPLITFSNLAAGGSGINAVCTEAPAITGPIIPGSNVSVAGSWTRLDASKPSTATITLYKNGVSVGTTTATTGNTWSINVASIASGDTLYARAQSVGESMCLRSSSVISGCSSVPSAPVLTCASSKGISGTITSGSSVQVYLIPTTTASPLSNPLTTNITYPTATSFAFYTAGCSGGSNNVANGTYMIIASNGGCLSAPTFECITSGSSSLVGLASNALTLVTPVYPFQTSISGLGATTGNILRLFVNGKYISTITATGASFSFTGLTLNAGDQIRIYAQSGTGCMTVSAAFTVSCYTQPPVILTDLSGKLLSTANSISGTSAYAGATVRLYKGIAPAGVAVGAAVTTSANGNWTVSGLTLAATETYYATITVGSCVSPASFAAGVLAATTICPTITGTYTEASNAVTGTLPSLFTGTVNLYLDGILIGTTVVTASTSWTISAPFTYSLYPGGVLTVSSLGIGAAENFLCSSSATIGCTSPSTPTVTPLTSSINSGQSVTFNVSNATTDTWYAVLDNSGKSYAGSVYKTNTTAFDISTTAFNTPGTYSLRISADKLSGCAASYRTASITVSSILPVTLVRFTAQRGQSGETVLQWVTASEQNTSRFEVEKSTDGRQFFSIGNLPAAGSSQSERRYVYTDKMPGTGTIYYRLRTIDLDGTSKLSDVAIVKSDVHSSVAAFPNPFNHEILVTLVSEKKQDVQVVLLDVTGKTLFRNKTVAAKGTQQIRLNQLQGLPAGIYTLVIHSDESVLQKKVVKL